MTSFVYLHCGDLGAMCHFYGTLLRLDEVFMSDEDQLVGYRIGSLQLTVQFDADVQPADGSWAKQLGWQGGTEARTSWGFELQGDTFARAVERLVDGGVPHRHEAPRWVGYWSFPVLDPMNNTVEVTAALRRAWPDESTDPAK